MKKCEGGCGRLMQKGGICQLCRADGTHNPSSTHPYFVYDPCGDNFVYFATLEAAINWAENNVIPEYCPDGWLEEIDQVVVGKLTHTVKQVDFKKSDDPRYDYCCDYVLNALADHAALAGGEE